MSRNTESLCCTPDIDSCIGAEVGRSPSILSAGLSIRLPATEATVSLFRQGTVNVFASGLGVQNIAGLSQSFGSPNVVNTSTISCAFLLKGIAVRFSVGANAYSVAGVAVPTPTALTDVQAQTGMPTGCSPNRPATFNLNQSAWAAAKCFLEAYVLYVKLGCKFILVNERLVDIGYIGASNSFCGFGTASMPISADVAEANDYAADVLKCGWQFMPLNAAGSCCADTPAIPLPEPLAEVQWGGPCFEGKYGGVFPVPMCLVLCPGMPMEYYLQTLTGTQCWQDCFLRNISDECEVTAGRLWSNKLVQTTCTVTTAAATTAVVTFPDGTTQNVAAANPLPSAAVCSSGSTSTVASGFSITFTVGGVPTTVGAGGIIPPTSATTVCNTSQIGWSSSVVFKGGCFSIEVALIGFELDADSCLAFFANFGQGMVGNVRELYLTHAGGYLQTAMMNSPQYRGLVGAGVAGLFGDAGLPHVRRGSFAPPTTLASLANPHGS